MDLPSSTGVDGTEEKRNQNYDPEGWRERWTSEGQSHNYGFSQKSSFRGAIGFKEKLISLNGYPKPYPMVVHTPIVSRWPPRGDLYYSMKIIRLNYGTLLYMISIL